MFKIISLDFISHIFSFPIKLASVRFVVLRVVGVMLGHLVCITNVYIRE